MRRTSLAKHAGLELEKAKLQRLEASLSDLVAYGEMSYSGRIPSSGPAAAEIVALLSELHSLKRAPTPTRKRVKA